MRILYGVQGTGNGHITRARAMAEAFSMHNISVDFVFSGRHADDYFDMTCFGHYRTYTGLSFVTVAGQVNKFATLRQAKLRQFYQDVKALDLSHYDVIISDYEPITAWAAKRQGRTCIGIGHQYAFNFSVPQCQNDLLGRWLMSYFAPVSVALGVHWHHYDQPILPPILQTLPDTEITPQLREVLVYLPFEEGDFVRQILQQLPEYHFNMHCRDLPPGDYANVTVYPFSRKGFQDNLQKSLSVLTNAGFELNSEALLLGRRILVKPLQGQIEQRSNAMALTQLGLGLASDVLDRHQIQDWLATSSVIQMSYPNVADAIVDWLLDGALHLNSIHQLSQALWSQVSKA